MTSPGRSGEGRARVQRWFRRFDTAPRDGTPFAVSHILRRNPVGDHWEVLCLDPETGKRSWQVYEWPENNEPGWWCNLPPLSFDLPAQGWFTMTFEARMMEVVAESFLSRCWRRFAKATGKATP